jgi:hypothetical protein
MPDSSGQSPSPQPRNRDDLLLARLEVVTANLDKLDAKIERVESKQVAKEPQNWWTLAAQILALPALIITMYMQINQGGESKQAAVLTQAQVAKTQAEELKTRAELQELLEKLSRSKETDARVYKQQLDRLLPQIDAALTTLTKLNVTSGAKATQDVLARYLLIWVFLTAIGITFSIIGFFWNSLFVVATTTLQALRPDYDAPEAARRRFRRIEKFQRFLPVLIPLPGIAHIAVDITIFGAVLIPLFDLLAKEMGSPITFGSILSNLWRLRFGDAIEALRRVVFP